MRSQRRLNKEQKMAKKSTAHSILLGIIQKVERASRRLLHYTALWWQSPLIAAELRKPYPFTRRVIKHIEQKAQQKLAEGKEVATPPPTKKKSQKRSHKRNKRKK
jgi:hypothetical protein